MANFIKQRSESVDIRGLLEVETPIGEVLSGTYKRSFAYFTIKDRLPVILTKLIDTMSRDKDEIAQNYGIEAKEDVKYIIGLVSKLKSELVTNKPLQLLLPNNTENDINKWNQVFTELYEKDGEAPTWFKTKWLYCECYMYRRLYQEISQTKWLSTYDPFEKQKKDSFENSILSMQDLSKHIINIVNNKSNLTQDEIKQEFLTLIKLNLWGNRCDLSLSAGGNVSQTGNPVKLLESLEKYLIVDNTNLVWDTIQNANTNTIDIILDNAGYELFTDLCLAVFLSSFKLAKNVRFYVKRMPWYVSDVTSTDFKWTVTAMQNSSNTHLAALGHKCDTFLKNATWSIEVESFWTEPYDFSQMKEKDINLYQKLSKANLIIFKGDLNYRKLLGDINWEHTTPLIQAIRGFHPSNITCLRTLKCDIIAGLTPGQSTKIQQDDPDWLISGKFGIIQTVQI